MRGSGPRGWGHSEGLRTAQAKVWPKDFQPELEIWTWMVSQYQQEHQQRVLLAPASFCCGNHGNSYFPGLVNLSMWPPTAGLSCSWPWTCDVGTSDRPPPSRAVLARIPSRPPFPHIWWRRTLPRKAISCLHRSSGSLGFSEAWPQPAHTACKHTEAWIEVFLQESASHHTPKAPCWVLPALDFTVS